MKTKLLILLSLIAAVCAYAGSATWNLNPTSGDWNTASNWTPNTVPNSPTDVATFDVSNTTDVAISGSVEVNEILFNTNLSQFTIAASPRFQLTLSGVGVTNSSEVMQSLVAAADEAGHLGTMTFVNSATVQGPVLLVAEGRTAGSIFDGGTILFTVASSAGDASFLNHGGTGFLGAGGIIQFSDSSSAGSGIFTTNGAEADTGQGGAITRFINTSSADHGTFTTKASSFSGALGGLTKFFDTSTAADGVFISYGAQVAGSGVGVVQFFGSSTAGNGNFTTNGAEASGGAGAFTDFFATSSAGNGTFTNNGGLVSGAYGGTTDFGRLFGGASTADNATLINNGGLTFGAGGGVTRFLGISTAANATLIANSGGTDESNGGTIQFLDQSSGGTSRVEVFGNGSLDISAHNHSGVAIGSIEGDGAIFLGSEPLTVGSSNLSTIFSGVTRDGGGHGGVGGALAKLGSGSLTLSRASLFTGGTTVEAGALLVTNQTGSASGSGAVTINAGTLGGKGIIAGPVAVGTGAGSGAFLAPAFGTNKQFTLTLQSSLTLQADATYTYTFKARRNTARTDQVVANDVTINNAAITVVGITHGQLRRGMILTVLSNTSANPISGTFSNLADGAIVNVNGNNLQASYTGGDGNDLTLTVVP